MSESDRLRSMLDKLGIEHFDYDKGGRTQTMWEAPDGERHFCYETAANPAKTSRLTISWFPTPEQAIAATLGSDREKAVERIERFCADYAALLDRANGVRPGSDEFGRLEQEESRMISELADELGVTE